MPASPWVVLSVPDGTAKCLRCSTTLTVELPVDLAAFIAALNRFGGEHAACRLQPSATP